MIKAMVILFLCLLSGTFFFLNYEKTSLNGRHCSGIMVLKAHVPKGSINYFAEVKMLFTNQNEGFYALSGTLTLDDKYYELRRNKYFTYSRIDNYGLYEMEITRETRSEEDTVPDDIAKMVFLPMGTTYMPSFRVLDDRALLISFLYSPFFVCTAD